MKVYVCGDTHIPIDLFKLKRDQWPEQNELTKNDLLIILGDFGGLWLDKSSKEETYWLNWLAGRKYTTCFLDGNHENFNRLNALDTCVFHGGLVGKAHRDIYHLKRGEVYKFDDKKVLVFGGAISVDKHLRQEGKSWWADEIPNEQDIQNLKANIFVYDNTFDFILTHTAPREYIIPMGLVKLNSMFAHKIEDPTCNVLQDLLYNNINFKQWHFGHFHKDTYYDGKFFCHYNNKPKRII